MPAPSTSTVFAARSSGSRAAAGSQAFGEAEAERELLVVPRRPHRHGDRPPADPDLERLLDRDQVALARPCGSRRTSTRAAEYGGATSASFSALMRGSVPRSRRTSATLP